MTNIIEKIRTTAILTRNACQGKAEILRIVKDFYRGKPRHYQNLAFHCRIHQFQIPAANTAH